MAKLSVRYTVVVYEDIDWPDDEMDNLDYDTLLCNLNIENKTDYEYEDITAIQKDGVEFYF